MEIQDPQSLDQTQTQIIKDHLIEVFNKVTPNRVKSTKEIVDEESPKQGITKIEPTMEELDHWKKLLDERARENHTQIYCTKTDVITEETIPKSKRIKIELPSQKRNFGNNGTSMLVC